MQGTKLFVGNLSYNTLDAKLKEVFSAFGTVVSVQVIMDKMTGRSRGFGFVEMSTKEEAYEALSKLNGTEVDGRKLNVNEARPREERPRI
jgi:cold-inducible RNA-binding protein